MTSTTRLDGATGSRTGEGHYNQREHS